MNAHVPTIASAALLIGLGLAVYGGVGEATERPRRLTEPVDTPAPLPSGVTQAMVAEGRTIFHGQGVCFACHGQQGAGGPIGPALADADWLNLKTGSFEEIVAVIQTGVAKPVKFPAPMPPNGGAALNAEQRRKVAAYVFSISHGG